MKSELLMEAIGYLPDDMVEKTDKLRTAKAVSWQKWVAWAACICLVLGAGSLLLPEMSGKSTNDSAAPEQVLTDEVGSTSMTPLTATVTTVEEDRLTVTLADGTQREVSLAQLSQIPALEPGMRIELYFAYVGTMDEDGTDIEQILTPCRIEIKEE